MLKNIFYAILLGAGMAACLSQKDGEDDDATAAASTEEVSASDTSQPAAPAAEQLRIAPGKVGFVTIGEAIEAMRQNIPEGFSIADTTLLQEGTQATAYLIKPVQHSKGILVEQQCNTTCSVWRLDVQSDAYQTTKGIRVGSTYGEVQQAHPISTVTLADGGLVAVAQDGNMSFVLHASQVPANQRARLTPQTVPADTQVKAILVY